MHARRIVAAALALLALGACPTAAAAPASTPARTPAGPSAGASSHSVPPAAPSPTDSGNSPDAPDPHPRRGGIGPHGEAVGGSALLSRGLVLPARAPALPTHLTARAWVLADLDSGSIIAARDPHGRYQPASIQKLLTTITLLPLLPGAKRVTVSRRSADTEGSHAGLVAGGSYTIDQIFEGLLLVSGNDAAEALAQAAGGRARTVALMNRTALGLGAYDTFIQTPSGLDGWKQLTSAYDMTLFLRAAVNQPRFVRYDRAHTAVLPKQKHTGAVRLDNQNVDFLDTVHGALAAKTGFTDAAQHTFAGAIERGGRRYGVVLLRAQRYPQDQYVQAAKLVTWAASLPAGTPPVGRLDAAATTRPVTTRPTGARTSRAGRASHPAPSDSNSSSNSNSASGTSHIGTKALIAVVIFGGLYLLMQQTRKRRRPRR